MGEPAVSERRDLFAVAALPERAENTGFQRRKPS
jgi:hypothetical protein